MSSKVTVKLKRVYEPPSDDDSTRILVERLWPRGLTKAKAAVDVWVKDVAPSPVLRKWFGHEPGKWSEFCRRYREELERNPDAIQVLIDKLRQNPVTFVYAAKDEQRNSAVVLRAFLKDRGVVS